MQLGLFTNSTTYLLFFPLTKQQEQQQQQQTFKVAQNSFQDVEFGG